MPKDENIARFAERNRQFVLKWRDRLNGRWLRPEESDTQLADGTPLYNDGWATTGTGSYIAVQGMPGNWYDVLDAFLGQIARKYPTFRILQIKLTLGHLRIYLGNVDTAAQQDADCLGRVLVDDGLE